MKNDLTQAFIEHIAKAPSQYDSLCRSLAGEVLSLRAESADLLVALKGLISPDGHGVYAISDVIEAAVAAIAKAEGR